MQLQAADDMLSFTGFADVKAATVLADGSVCVVGQACRGGRDFGEGQVVIYPPGGQSPRTLHLDYSPMAVFSAHDGSLYDWQAPQEVQPPPYAQPPKPSAYRLHQLHLPWGIPREHDAHRSHTVLG